MSKTYTLDELNCKKASETPHTFEFQFDGKPSGIMLSVIGQQSETFQTGHDKLLKEFELAKSLADDPAAFMAGPKAKELTYRLAAIRLVEWAGITEPLTPETAYQFVCNTDGAFAQVCAASNKIGNFIKL